MMANIFSQLVNSIIALLMEFSVGRRIWSFNAHDLKVCHRALTTFIGDRDCFDQTLMNAIAITLRSSMRARSRQEALFANLVQGLLPILKLHGHNLIQPLLPNIAIGFRVPSFQADTSICSNDTFRYCLLHVTHETTVFSLYLIPT
jgi:hypothetical protein